MSGTVSKNLGLVSAIKYGTTEPSNKLLIWYDTNFNPPKRKMWDESVQQWGEFIFVMSPVTSLKRLFTNNLADSQVNMTVTTQDCLIKTDNGNTFINLPEPNNETLGRVIEIANLSEDGKIYFNYPIYTIANQTQEILGANRSMKLICVVSSDVVNTNYKWYVIQNNIITIG